MKYVLIEIRKSLCNTFFLFSVICMSLFSLMSASYVIYTYNININHIFPTQIQNGVNELYPIWNFFQNWVGAERISMAGTVFYTLMPLFCSFPAGLSFYKERKSGYVRVISCRTGRLSYFISKVFGVFLSGFLIVFISLLANVFIVSAFIPTTSPQVNYNFYTYVTFGDLWADLFFSSPWLYVFLYVLLDSIVGGLYSILTLSISFITRFSIVAALFPFLLVLSLEYLSKALSNINSSGFLNCEISPLEWVRASHFYLPVNWTAVVAQIVLAIIFSACIIIVKGIKNEIY